MSELSIPFQEKGDRLQLGEIHDLVHEAISDPKERAVTYELLFDLATTTGIDTYGDVLDRLEKAGTDGRRRLGGPGAIEPRNGEPCRRGGSPSLRGCEPCAQTKARRPGQDFPGLRGGKLQRLAAR